MDNLWDGNIWSKLCAGFCKDSTSTAASSQVDCEIAVAWHKIGGIASRTTLLAITTSGRKKTLTGNFPCVFLKRSWSAVLVWDCTWSRLQGVALTGLFISLHCFNESCFSSHPKEVGGSLQYSKCRFLKDYHQLAYGQITPWIPQLHYYKSPKTVANYPEEYKQQLTWQVFADYSV